MNNIVRFLLAFCLCSVFFGNALAQPQGLDQILVRPEGGVPSPALTPAASAAAIAAANAANTAAAQSAANGGTASLGRISDIVTKSLGINILQRFVKAAEPVARDLKSYALILGGALALASMTWNIMMAIALRDSPMDVALEAIIYASMAAFLIANYGLIVGDLVAVGSKIITASGFGDLSTVLADFIFSYFQKLFETVMTGLAKMASFTGWFTGALDLIISGVLLVVAFVFGIRALIELIGVALLGPVLVGVGIAVGPLFIACLASNWTRSWFQKWLDFLLNGTVLTAIVVIVVGLVKNVIVVSNPVVGGSLTGEALSLALISVALGKIFSSIPGMVDALLPGRSHGKAMSGKEIKEAFKDDKKG